MLKAKTILTIQLVFGLISTIYIIYSLYGDIREKRKQIS